MSKLVYHIIVYPLSLLPLRVLYLFSDFLAFVFIYVFPYRRKVVWGNLRRSFPDKNDQEIKRLQKMFYRHFCDILIEGVKNLSITERELRKRMKIKNPEVMADLYRQNRSALLVSGHFNNWEWLITSQNFLLPHQAVGIGMPLSSKFWDKKLNERRARFGMKIIHSKQVKGFFAQHFEKPTATLILSDQSPGDSHKAYWMNFLNQQTAVLFGCELLAHQYHQAVVFFKTKKVKRGFYEIEFELITNDPSRMGWGEITERHTRLLEQTIYENPAFWMWSHKRWKRDIPTDLDSLKREQKENFELKIKS